MIAIEKQLRRYFLIVTIISVLVIFVFSNVGMTIFFNSYVHQAELKSDQKVVQYMEDLFGLEKGFAMGTYPGLMQFIWGEGAEVLLYDNAGHLLFDSRTVGNVHRGKGWGQSQSPGQGQGQGSGITESEKATLDKDLVFKEYPLRVDGIKIATVEIGRTQSLLSSAEDRTFFLTMNGVYVAALLLSIGLVVVMSKYTSGKFLKPLLDVKANIQAISGKQQVKNGLIPVVSNTAEIQQLAQATEELSQTIRAQDQLRKRLTSDVAHELRTPLSTLQSHLEAMIDGIWEPTPQRLSFCYDELIRLTRLINDLNELSVIENEKLKINFAQVDVTILLTRMLENFKLMFDEKQIGFESQIQTAMKILGDSDRLKQILVNILANAYKYTPEQGKITVKAYTEGEQVKIEVEDNGVGISAQDLPYIFERFYRGDISRSRESGGSGIGLTIAKALTEAHNGKLELRSEQNVGTRVTLSFPIFH